MIPRDLYLAVTPIFTPEIGKRLAIARMKLMMTQGELGAKLGVKQQTIAKLERGQQQTMDRPFTYHAFMTVLGTSVHFVMFGTNPERYPASIQREYWAKKYKRPKKGKVPNVG